jgi:cystathionine beta-lyase/cystathionine gamma-synthase
MLAAAAPGDPCWRCGHACCPSLAAAQLGGMATGPRLRRLRQLAAPLRPLCTSARRPQPPLDASTLGIHADAPGSSSGGAAAAAAAAVGPWSHERDVAPPIGVTTTFEAAEDGHVYSRQSQPTRDRCESVLAALEATPGLPTPHALLYSSGLAACHAIMVALLPTTRRIVVSGGYHGTHQVIDILKELRAELDIIELPTVEDAEALLQPTDLVWLETPRNPMCEVYDIAGYANLSCKPAVVVDGTFAPPPMQRALALGATAVMHSTTKCECATPPSCHPASVPPGQSVMKQRHCLAVVCPDLSGHSDAVGGALCVDDDELAERLRAQRTAIGGVPGSLEVWLLLRSLRTLPLRLERHNTSAILIAAWLQQSIKDSDHPLHGLVERVWHPSLPDHPGHDVAVRQMAPQHFGGVLSVELRSEAAAKALPQAVRCTHPCTHAPTHPRTHTLSLSLAGRRATGVVNLIPPAVRLPACSAYCAASSVWRCHLPRGRGVPGRVAA